MSLIPLVYLTKVFLNTLETKTQMQVKCVLMLDLPIYKNMTLTNSIIKTIQKPIETNMSDFSDRYINELTKSGVMPQFYKMLM